ncbi:glycosyltransferase family 2 protein [Saccharopolyspora karakumensis]|nr:glycosyltransferase [Saccharopolyspora karakumensis]
MTTTDGPGSVERFVTDLSNGNIATMGPAGPKFTRTSRRKRPARSTFVHALARRDRVVIGVLSAGWLASLVYFWCWWLQPAHRASVFGLVANSVLIAYLSVMPAYFLLSINRMRKVDPTKRLPAVRTAMVVTKAPSEPWSMVRRTLQAMLVQRYPGPYDVWLCDEDPTDEALRWCAESGVLVSTRRDRPDYHRSAWPRRTKCKEGNLTFFYDHWGYEHYDVVAQLDSDHVPTESYLAEMVRPFADPAIGWVSAPSVCDANAGESWSARGRLYREAAFHGPMQMGHSGKYAPVCIGSHYAVRTSALREIGGLGPELAEDFSTTFLLSSAGWSGAFAPDAIANGTGPVGFGGMITQEFQWSRSLVTLLMGLVPRHVPRFPWYLRVRFLLVLTYYPLVAFTTMAGLVLPAVAAVTGVPWINVNYFSFLAHWWAVFVWLFAIQLLLRRRGLLRPPYAPVISWEMWLFALARWPYVALGVSAAVVQKVRRAPLTFKVTPKAQNRLEPMPRRLIAPYVMIAVGLSLSAVVGELYTNAIGYTFLCLLGSTVYTAVAVILPLLHALENARSAAVPLGVAFDVTAAAPMRLAVSALFPLGLAISMYPPYVDILLGWF